MVFRVLTALIFVLILYRLVRLKTPLYSSPCCCNDSWNLFDRLSRKQVSQNATKHRGSNSLSNPYLDRNLYPELINTVLKINNLGILRIAFPSRPMVPCNQYFASKHSSDSGLCMLHLKPTRWKDGSLLYHPICLRRVQSSDIPQPSCGVSDSYKYPQLKYLAAFRED